MVQRRTVLPASLAAILTTALVGAAPATAATSVLTVDLGATTGAFHGGAAGSLYGVYGDGVPSGNALAGFYPKTLATTRRRTAPSTRAPMPSKSRSRSSPPGGGMSTST